jgi:hypothetical protein
MSLVNNSALYVHGESSIFITIIVSETSKTDEVGYCNMKLASIIFVQARKGCYENIASIILQYLIHQCFFKRSVVLIIAF